MPHAGEALLSPSEPGDQCPHRVDRDVLGGEEREVDVRDGRVPTGSAPSDDLPGLDPITARKAGRVGLEVRVVPGRPVLPLEERLPATQPIRAEPHDPSLDGEDRRPVPAQDVLPVMGVITADEPRGPPAVRPGRRTHNEERRVDLVRDPSSIPPPPPSAIGRSVEDGGSVRPPSWIRSPALPRASMPAALPLGASEPIVGDALASPGPEANPWFRRERRERRERGCEGRPDGRRRRRRRRGSGSRSRGGGIGGRRWRGLVGRRGGRFRRRWGTGWRRRDLGTRDRPRPRRQ
jgi:hypothetical protein